MRCLYCNTNHESLGKLFDHLRKEHEVDESNIFLKFFKECLAKGKPKNKKLITCLVCGKTFNKPLVYSIHLLKSHISYGVPYDDSVIDKKINVSYKKFDYVMISQSVKTLSFEINYVDHKDLYEFNDISLVNIFGGLMYDRSLRTLFTKKYYDGEMIVNNDYSIYSVISIVNARDTVNGTHVLPARNFSTTNAVTSVINQDVVDEQVNAMGARIFYLDDRFGSGVRMHRINFMRTHIMRIEEGPLRSAYFGGRKRKQNDVSDSEDDDIDISRLTSTKKPFILDPDSDSSEDEPTKSDVEMIDDSEKAPESPIRVLQPEKNEFDFILDFSDSSDDEISCTANTKMSSYSKLNKKAALFVAKNIEEDTGVLLDEDNITQRSNLKNTLALAHLRCQQEQASYIKNCDEIDEGDLSFEHDSNFIVDDEKLDDVGIVLQNISKETEEINMVKKLSGLNRFMLAMFKESRKYRSNTQGGYCLFEAIIRALFNGKYYETVNDVFEDYERTNMNVTRSFMKKLYNFKNKLVNVSLDNLNVIKEVGDFLIKVGYVLNIYYYDLPESKDFEILSVSKKASNIKMLRFLDVYYTNSYKRAKEVEMSLNVCFNINLTENNFEVEVRYLENTNVFFCGLTEKNKGGLHSCYHCTVCDAVFSCKRKKRFVDHIAECRSKTSYGNLNLQPLYVEKTYKCIQEPPFTIYYDIETTTNEASYDTFSYVITYVENLSYSEDRQKKYTSVKIINMSVSELCDFNLPPHIWKAISSVDREEFEITAKKAFYKNNKSVYTALCIHEMAIICKTAARYFKIVSGAINSSLSLKEVNDYNAKHREEDKKMCVYCGFEIHGPRQGIGSEFKIANQDYILNITKSLHIHLHEHGDYNKDIAWFNNVIRAACKYYMLMKNVVLSASNYTLDSEYENRERLLDKNSALFAYLKGTKISLKQLCLKISLTNLYMKTEEVENTMDSGEIKTSLKLKLMAWLLNKFSKKKLTLKQDIVNRSSMSRLVSALENNDAVVDHDHYNTNKKTKIRGYAHRVCNSKGQLNKKVCVTAYAHNGGRFDTQLMFREFRAANWCTDNVFVIGKSASSINYFIVTGQHYKISFGDTLKYYMMSLNKWSSIVNGVKDEIKQDMTHYFEDSRVFNCRWYCLPDEQKKRILELSCSKGVIPYEKFKTGEECKEPVLPSKKEFMSLLTKSDEVDEEAYENVKEVWDILDRRQ